MAANIMWSDRRQSANLRRVVHLEASHSTTHGLPVSASRRRDLSRAGADRGPARTLHSSVSAGDLHRLAPTKLRAIHPHPVEYSPKLAGQRDLCPLLTATLGDIHRPALERGETYRSAQHRIGCFVERGAHHRIAHLADP